MGASRRAAGVLSRPVARTGPTFVALDFETANRRPDSPCALGVVVVDRGRVVGRHKWLIDPETDDFHFSYIHGITAADVADAPTFAEVWPEVRPLLRAGPLAAHNARFDIRVLRATCEWYGLRVSVPRVLCTQAAATRLYPARGQRLPDVCRRLRIRLDHHEPLSDAHACARILTRATRDHGWRRVVSAATVEA